MRGHKVLPINCDLSADVEKDVRGSAPDKMAVAVNKGRPSKVLGYLSRAMHAGKKSGSSPDSSAPGPESHIPKPPVVHKDQIRHAESVDSKQESDTCQPKSAWGSDQSQPAPRTSHQSRSRLTSQQRAYGTLPIHRCYSSGGIPNGKTNNSRGLYRPASSASTAGPDITTVAPFGYTSESGLAPNGASGPTTASLLDALQNVAAAASCSVSALSRARQAHEELLEQQRQQFQALMSGVQAKRAAARSTTPPANATPALSSPASYNSGSGHSMETSSTDSSFLTCTSGGCGYSQASPPSSTSASLGGHAPCADPILPAPLPPCDGSSAALARRRSSSAGGWVPADEPASSSSSLSFPFSSSSHSFPSFSSSSVTAQDQLQQQQYNHHHHHLAFSPHQQQFQQDQQPEPEVSLPSLPYITTVYHGVQFNMPVFCQITSRHLRGSGMQREEEVAVTGPGVEVELAFREGGRRAVLVSSSCACTVKRLDERYVVNVLPPQQSYLLQHRMGRSKSHS